MFPQLLPKMSIDENASIFELFCESELDKVSLKIIQGIFFSLPAALLKMSPPNPHYIRTFADTSFSPLLNWSH